MSLLDGEERVEPIPIVELRLEATSFHITPVSLAVQGNDIREIMLLRQEEI